MDIVQKLLKKSKDQTKPSNTQPYEKAFENYNTWCTNERLDLKSINNLHAYIVFISDKYTPTTCNTHLSYIKTQLKEKKLKFISTLII